MTLWILMCATASLVPLIMIISGGCFSRKAPKKINNLFFAPMVGFSIKKSPASFLPKVYSKRQGIYVFYSVDAGVSFFVSLMVISLPLSTETPCLGSCSVTMLLPISPSNITSKPSFCNAETASV